MDVRNLKTDAPEKINPAFWIDAIRTAMHCTDCDSKLRTLANAANHLGAFIKHQRGIVADLAREAAIPAANPAQGGEEFFRIVGWWIEEEKRIMQGNAVDVGTYCAANGYAKPQDCRVYDRRASSPAAPAAVAQETDISRELWAARSTMLDLRYTYSGGMKWSPPPSPAVAMEPNGGNVNRPHALMVTSGQFWRCMHGNTGLKGNGQWLGCIECDAIDNASLAAPAVAREVDGMVSIAKVREAMVTQVSTWQGKGNARIVEIACDCILAAISPPLGGGGES